RQRLARRTISLGFSSHDLAYLDPSRHAHRRQRQARRHWRYCSSSGKDCGPRPSLAGEANKAIDAAGLAVTPGFIDIKTHSDFVLPINPKAESKVRQGVTTEIIGHCGFSVAPVLQGKTQLLADYLSWRRAVAATLRTAIREI